MAQMRVLKKHAESEFSAENGAAYTAVMLHTVEQISPEIYELQRASGQFPQCGKAYAGAVL